MIASGVNPSDKGPLAIYLPSLGRHGLGGGAERAAVTLAREFVEAGERVDLILSVTHPSSLAEVDPRVRIIDLNCRRLWTSLPRLTLYRWRERPRVILSLMPLANSLNVVSKWFGPRHSRAVISERSTQTIATNANFSAEGTRLLHPLCRLTYPRADAIIGCSNGVAQRVVAVYPRTASRTIGIPNPTAPSPGHSPEIPHRWLSDHTVPCIVAVGRLHAAKDHLTLLRTASRIREDREVRLLVLGEGPMRTEIEAEIERLQLVEAVQLLGHQLNPRDYLASADVFLHTARWEGFGNVLVEALAEGVPVVSTDCESGPREILDAGRFGRLAPVGDVDALAMAVLETLDEPRQPGQLRHRAASFAPPAIAARYLEVIARAVAQQPVSTGSSSP